MGQRGGSRASAPRGGGLSQRARAAQGVWLCILPCMIGAEHLLDGLPHHLSPGKDPVLQHVKCPVRLRTCSSQCSQGPLADQRWFVTALWECFWMSPLSPSSTQASPWLPVPAWSPLHPPRSWWTWGMVQAAAVQVPALDAASHGDGPA